jgi:hypothetical protein
LPDGKSEIFFAEGLDSKIGQLPVGQITPSTNAKASVEARRASAFAHLATMLVSALGPAGAEMFA